MDMRAFLGLLAGVSGPSASGEYMARCPAHDDKTASLSARVKRSAKDGKERIYFCCQAGCSHAAILDALRITDKDLVASPDSGERSPEGGRVYAAKPTAPATKQTDKKPQPRIDFDHPTRVYSYQDADGGEAYQVCRYEYADETGKRQKTFRQRRYAPGDERATRAGYVMSVPEELRCTIPYRLPELLSAIQDKRPVYIVEGEKDVETLARLGMAATCNAGGAGKWRPTLSAWLDGADVIVLPDCDTRDNGFAGQMHAYDVCITLGGIAKRVRLVDIKAACPDIPPKGDITDMVELMGDQAALDALHRQVEQTKTFDASDVPFWLSPMEQAAALYGRVPGYTIAGCGIAQLTDSGSKQLADFCVLPRAELIRDDGVQQSMYFVLDGYTETRSLGRVTISAKDLDSMSWVTSKWGFSASLAPGSTTAGKVAWAIKKVGQQIAQRVTEYTHTGWRKIDGQWCYLYHGGAIGRDGITVDLGDALSSYRLDGCGAPGYDEISYKDGAAVSWSIKDAMARRVSVALLGTMYLAPLREFLLASDVVPAFSLYLYGQSGTHKTTAASLALSHFGNFHAKNPPASFNDTANQIRRKAFVIKDAPILVDDFHPVSSQQERRQMMATAQALSRAFGDGVDRGRLNADSSIKASTPPRSVAVITGEDLPAIGESGLARFYIIEMERGDVPIGKELTALQDKARAGYLRKAMRGYITWLSKQADGMPERLHGLFQQYREEVRAMDHGQHDRAPEAVACILIGYGMMLNYFRDVGLLDMHDCILELSAARAVLMETSRKQTVDAASERPSQIFLDLTREMLINKSIFCQDLEIQDRATLGRVMVGYRDRMYYYFQPNSIYTEVAKLCRDQGVEFPVSLKALYKHLKADGIIPGGEDVPPTRCKFIDGRTVRLIWIPRRLIDGEKPKETAMEEAVVVQEELDLPPEWK